jgi:two-component system, sensor histidine kinase and response regulator
MDANLAPRILLIEDNELISHWMCVQLGKLGYHLHALESAELALHHLRQEAADLILLDINLPGMSGIELLKQLRQDHSLLALPIIMVTAEEDVGQIVTALQNGANDYIIKPLNPEVADARIRTQLTLKHYATLKDEAIRFASHDLKKPLLIMQDMFDQLAHELAMTPANIAECTLLSGLMQQTLTQMAGIVQGFLQQSTRQTQSALQERIDLNHLVSDVVRDNSRYAEQKHITLQTSLAASLPMIRANVFQLRQVIENLLGNALKFSPAGSTTRLLTSRDGDYIKLAVQDAGPGLRDADFPKLFVHGARLSNQPTGKETSSGIGLALCKEFIHQLSGDIGAHNNPDKGATFWFRLPTTPAYR